MSLANYFPVWDKLTAQQQERITTASEFRKVKAGTVDRKSVV